MTGFRQNDTPVLRLPPSDKRVVTTAKMGTNGGPEAKDSSDMSMSTTTKPSASSLLKDYEREARGRKDREWWAENQPEVLIPTLPKSSLEKFKRKRKRSDLVKLQWRSRIDGAGGGGSEPHERTVNTSRAGLAISTDMVPRLGNTPSSLQESGISALSTALSPILIDRQTASTGQSQVDLQSHSMPPPHNRLTECVLPCVPASAATAAHGYQSIPSENLTLNPSKFRPQPKYVTNGTLEQRAGSRGNPASVHPVQQSNLLNHTNSAHPPGAVPSQSSNSNLRNNDENAIRGLIGTLHKNIQDLSSLYNAYSTAPSNPQLRDHFVKLIKDGPNVEDLDKQGEEAPTARLFTEDELVKEVVRAHREGIEMGVNCYKAANHLADGNNGREKETLEANASIDKMRRELEQSKQWLRAIVHSRKVRYLPAMDAVIGLADKAEWLWDGAEHGTEGNENAFNLG